MRTLFVLSIVAASIVAASGSVDAGSASPNSSCNSNRACLAWLNQGAGAAVNGASAKGDGLVGSTSNRSFASSGAGVLGMDKSSGNTTTNFGIEGVTVLGVGVLGTSGYGTGVGAFSENGTGLQAQSVGKVGIFGQAETWPGVWGLALPGSGVLAQGGGTDDQAFVHPALGIVTQSSTGDQIDGCSISVAPCTTSNSSFRVDQAGNIYITGQIFTGGSCSNGCSQHPNAPGKRIVSYAPRESMPIMEDFGEAQLVNGRAYVSIDASFGSVIDHGRPYLVFMTPDGDTRGLYVEKKTASGFAVREAQGGRSTISFDYRIVAHPLDDAAPRLPTIEIAGRPSNGASFAESPKRLVVPSPHH